MSKCHFPQDNFTIILDLPQVQHSSLRLIETLHLLPNPSILTLTHLDKPLNATRPLLEEDDQDSLGMGLQSHSEEGPRKTKKTGCTCKKTNCAKMYCECFAVGRVCGAECGCVGCLNQEQEEVAERPKIRGTGGNRHTQRGCNCRKTNCQKKYCECFNAGVACGEHCNCMDCCNGSD